MSLCGIISYPGLKNYMTAQTQSKSKLSIVTGS